MVLEFIEEEWDEVAKGRCEDAVVQIHGFVGIEGPVVPGADADQREHREPGGVHPLRCAEQMRAVPAP